MDIQQILAYNVTKMRRVTIKSCVFGQFSAIFPQFGHILLHNATKTYVITVDDAFV